MRRWFVGVEGSWREDRSAVAPGDNAGALWAGRVRVLDYRVWLRQSLAGKSEIAMSASWLATKSMSQLKAADMKP